MTIAALPAAQSNGFTVAPAVVILFAAFLALSLSVYGRISSRIVREGGRVPNDLLGLPDLLVTIVLGGFFAFLAIHALLHPAKESPKLTPEQAISGQVLMLLFAGGIAGFLRGRRVSVGALVGVRNLSIPRVALRALAMMAAAIPLIWATSLLSLLLPQQLAEEQQLVAMFKDVSKHGDWSGISFIFLTGVLLAPPLEEFLFRAYFYGSIKRFTGFPTATVASSALFALSHGNLASLPGLFVLSCCFVVAYEATGSLLVTMGMHALFNAGNLVLLYLVSRNAA